MPDIQSDQYATWSDEQLVRATTLDLDDYVPEAQAAIRAELRGRQLSRWEVYQAEKKVWNQQDEEDRKVGGWLMVFLVLLAAWSLVHLLSPLTTTSYIYWVLPYAPAATIELSLGAGCVTVFLSLVLKKPVGPRYAITLLWVLLVDAAVACVVIMYNGGVPNVLSLAVLAAWIVYFRRSRRVARTYGA